MRTAVSTFPANMAVKEEVVTAAVVPSENLTNYHRTPPDDPRMN